MSLNILDSFNYQGKNQNFARDSFKTIAEMVAYPETSLPDIFTATNEETGKQYIFNVNNTVDATLGKWRENSVSVSADADNAIVQNTDGIYVKDFPNRVDVLDKLSKDANTGDLLFDGTPIKGGVEFNEWVSGAEYVVDDYVVNEGVLYKCNTDHTAGSDFEIDIANWDKVIGATDADTVDGNHIVEITQTDYDAMIAAGKEDADTIYLIQDATSNSVRKNFLSAEGYGGLRFYGGVHQYYDEETQTWIDISLNMDNACIINMTPGAMQKFNAICDTANKVIKLKWKEPANTTIDGQLACYVEGVKIVRKDGSEPVDENDGTLIIDVKHIDFGRYNSVWYIDDDSSLEVDHIYYYKAFPYSDTGLMSDLSENCINIKFKDYELYGFVFDTNESDPFSNISYIEDNEYYDSVYMDYTSDIFNYGDWNNAFFMKGCKPCMVKYDGTVDYYLNPNKYSLKEDGTASDITDTSYSGNVMVEFPLIYYKILDNGDDTYNFYFSNKQVDDTFKPWWSFYDANGNVIPACYIAAYQGSLVDSTVRSISGQTNMHDQSGNDEITFANKNNTNGNVNDVWYTSLYSDKQLVTMLLMLIGKNTDSQTTFGSGNSCIAANGISTTIASGTMDDKGLFWGSNVTDTRTGVKTFGVENCWGNQSCRIAGLINDNGIIKVKMTHCQLDGSTVTGYNVDGTGYINTGITPSGPDGGYINAMSVCDYGIIPCQSKGSATTYGCDMMWYDNTMTSYALVGGFINAKLGCGINYVMLSFDTTNTDWNNSTSLSCKPLATN